MRHALGLIVLISACFSGPSTSTSGPCRPSLFVPASGPVALGSDVAIVAGGRTCDSPHWVWTLRERPEGSTVSLETPQLNEVRFTPDVAGDYVVTVRRGALHAEIAVTTVDAALFAPAPTWSHLEASCSDFEALDGALACVEGGLLRLDLRSGERVPKVAPDPKFWGVAAQGTRVVAASLACHRCAGDSFDFGCCAQAVPGGVDLFDASNGALQAIAHADLEVADEPALDGATIAVSTSGAGVTLFDLTDPSTLQRIGHVPRSLVGATGNRIVQFQGMRLPSTLPVLDGDRLFVLEREVALYSIAEARTHEAAPPLSTLPLQVDVFDAVASGGVLYTAGGDGLRAIDARDGRLSPSRALGWLAPASSLAVTEGRLVVAGTGFVAMLSIEDPLSPRLIRVFPLERHTGIRVRASGSAIVLVDDKGEVAQLSLE